MRTERNRTALWPFVGGCAVPVMSAIGRSLPRWNSYEGDFKNGRMHGVGVYRWHHGDVYRGSWQNDRRSGRGRYEWTDLGLIFDGMFEDDRRTGRGSIIFPDSSR